MRGRADSVASCLRDAIKISSVHDEYTVSTCVSGCGRVRDWGLLTGMSRFIVSDTMLSPEEDVSPL